MSFRIGVNSGPLIASVNSRRKFEYDVWGDAVNVARSASTRPDENRRRRQSSGLPGVAGMRDEVQ